MCITEIQILVGELPRGDCMHAEKLGLNSVEFTSYIGKVTINYCVICMQT